MVDRLLELGLNPLGDDDETGEDMETGNAEITEHMKAYEPIKLGITRIGNNITEINSLKEKQRTVAIEKEKKAMYDRTEAVFAQTTKLGRQIKAQLDAIRASNITYKQKHENESAKAQARENLYATNVRRFHSTMTEYNTASLEYKHVLNDNLARQLKIVDSKGEMSDDKIQEIIQSGQAQQVIQKALITGHLTDAISDIEDRHQDIMKLEQQVLEVYELFRDLATLVDLQQESLDVIENRVTSSKAYVEVGQKALGKAEVSQKKARRKKCCLIIVFLVILVIMLSSILGTALKDA